MLILTTFKYNPIRNGDILKCIYNNSKLEQISKIVLFYEHSLDNNDEMELLTTMKKIDNVQVISTSKRPTVRKMVNFVNNTYPNNICILTNSDISFNSSLGHLQKVDFEDCNIALTRYNIINRNDNSHRIYKGLFLPLGENTLLKTVHENGSSIDSWIYKTPLNTNSMDLDVYLGQYGVDGYLNKQFSKHNKIFNPVRDIISIHIDEKWNMTDYYVGENIGKHKVPLKYVVNEVCVDFCFVNECSQNIKKVISYSLWGNQLIYNIGAIENAKIAKKLFPGYECWYYIHYDSVPKYIIRQLSELKNVRIIPKYGDISQLKPRMWRFEAIDNPKVKIMLSRDTDTRLLHREKVYNSQWLKSNKSFHIIRDHPDHKFHILAGMFATRKLKCIDSWKKLIDEFKPRHQRFYDQDFLKEIIYPKIKNDVCICSPSIRLFDNETNQLFVPHCGDFKFIGEYIDENDKRSKIHIVKLQKYIEANLI